MGTATANVSAVSPDDGESQPQGYGHITLSGDLGSGKSSVATELERRLGMPICSTGELHRKIAAELGQSALETNRTALTDDSIDRRIDGMTVEIGRGDVPTIFDSRMAWHMVDDALRVHLVVDADEAARRVFSRAATAVEGYRSVHEASEGLKERASVERRRFSAKYGVDIVALANYDLVVDTTRLPVEAVADLIERIFRAGRRDQPKAWLNPTRVKDLSAVRLPAGLQAYVDDVGAAARADVLNVFFVAPEFFVLRPEDVATLEELRTAGDQLVAANLLADGIEAKDQGIYLARAVVGARSETERRTVSA